MYIHIFRYVTFKHYTMIPIIFPLIYWNAVTKKTSSRKYDLK